MIGQKIKEVLEGKRISKSDFAKKIEMKPQNLSKLFQRDSIESKTLGKIALALEVPVSALFEQDSSVIQLLEKFSTILGVPIDNLFETFYPDPQDRVQIYPHPQTLNRVTKKEPSSSEDQVLSLTKEINLLQKQIEELKGDKEELKKDKADLRKLLEEARAGREGLKNDQITYGK